MLQQPKKLSTEQSITNTLEDQPTQVNSLVENDPAAFFNLRMLQIRENLLTGNQDQATELYASLQQTLSTTQYPDLYANFFSILEEGNIEPSVITALVKSVKPLDLPKVNEENQITTSSATLVHPAEATTTVVKREVRRYNPEIIKQLVGAISHSTSTFSSILIGMVNNKLLSWEEGVSMPEVREVAKQGLIHCFEHSYSTMSSQMSELIRLKVFTHQEIVAMPEIIHINKKYLKAGLQHSQSTLNTFIRETLRLGVMTEAEIRDYLTRG